MDAVIEHTRTHYDQIGKDAPEIEPTDEETYFRSLADFGFSPGVYRLEGPPPATSEEDMFAFGEFQFTPRALAVYTPTQTESEFLSPIGDVVDVDPSRVYSLEGLEPPTVVTAERESEQPTLALTFEQKPSETKDSQAVELPGSPAADEGPWVCPRCGKEIRRHGPAIARHEKACEREQAEREELPYVCPQCDRRFKSEQGLRSHVGRSH